MRSDDLTALFLATPEKSPFRQGVIQTYSTLTGANSVLVGGNTVADGAVLTNLPILNIGDTVNLTLGDVVIIMKYADSWAILGRVITPGASNALNSSAVDFETAIGFASSFALSTSEVAQITTLMNVPAWANQALVVVTSGMTVTNTSGTARSVAVESQVDGFSTTVGGQTFAPTVGACFCSHQTAREYAVTPGGTITLTSLVIATGAIAGNVGTFMSLSAYATFRKV